MTPKGPFGLCPLGGGAGGQEGLGGGTKRAGVAVGHGQRYAPRRRNVGAGGGEGRWDDCRSHKGVAGILGKGKPWKRKKFMVGKCNLMFRRLV